MRGFIALLIAITAINLHCGLNGSESIPTARTMAPIVVGMWVSTTAAEPASCRRDTSDDQDGTHYWNIAESTAVLCFRRNEDRTVCGATYDTWMRDGDTLRFTHYRETETGEQDAPFVAAYHFRKTLHGFDVKIDEQWISFVPENPY
ncbi:MAG: hypothetical protein GF344_13500 [Chitinivibrionales bacterium]|nr:hypothetical protein [Chitinivibrionales bacterium]MBD3357746.1 hypothetical protein [Chitinivibrionales bacterium]